MSGPVICAVVHGLDDLSRWTDHCLAVALDILDTRSSSLSLQDIAAASSELSMRYCFSGIGCPEHARHMSPCATELLVHPTPPECLFSDIAESIDPRVRQLLLSNAANMGFDALAQICTHKKIVVDPLWCKIHRRFCHMKRARIHIAGTECVAWSRQGKQAGAIGQKALFFFALIGQRRLLQ